MEFFDVVPPARTRSGRRGVVPPGVARYGSFLERGVILMPGYEHRSARAGEYDGGHLGHGGPQVGARVP